jgi:thymidylate synthase
MIKVDKKNALGRKQIQNWIGHQRKKCQAPAEFDLDQIKALINRLK